MTFAETVEGSTRLFVPKASLEGAVPPTAPVFFNPIAVTNRNVSVSVAAVSGKKTFCDSLAGVGARGVRVANESSVEKVTLVDFNAESLKLAKASAKANGVLGGCEFEESESCAFLHSAYGREVKFEAIDVDPFGTPARFIQPALSAIADGGVLSLTATDTAVLCGVHVDVCRRRYGATPLNNSFHHETGVRILLNAVRREAASLDLGVEPLLAHSTKHYIRVFARVLVGPSKADASMRGEGYITWCPKCGHTEAAERLEWACRLCGGKAKSAGPLWVGKVTDEGLVRGALDDSRRRGFRDSSKILAGLGRVDEFPPWSYSMEGICSALGIASVPDEKVAEALRSVGFASSRQPFEKTGIKSRASYEEVVKAVRAASGPGKGPERRARRGVRTGAPR